MWSWPYLCFTGESHQWGGEWVWRETETGPALMLPGCVHVALLLEGAKATVPCTFHSSWRAQVH